MNIVPLTFESIPNNVIFHDIAKSLKKKEVAHLRVNRRLYILLTPTIADLIAKRAVQEKLRTEGRFQTPPPNAHHHFVTCLTLHNLKFYKSCLQEVSNHYPNLRSLEISKCAIWEDDLSERKRRRLKVQVRFLSVQSLKIKMLKSWCNVLEWFPNGLEELYLQHVFIDEGQWRKSHSFFRSLSELSKCTQLRNLSLFCSDVTEEHLFNLPHSLTSLSLSLIGLSEKGTHALMRMTGLESLCLSINDRMPSATSFIPTNVTQLSLNPWNLGDDSLALSHLIRLRSLKMGGRNPSIEGRALCALTEQLSELNLHSCNLTDDNFKQLARFSQLTALNVQCNTRLTGLFFSLLSPSLTELVADRCDITDENLGRLDHCCNLIKLIVFENKKITGSSFHQLPNSIIHLDANYCTLEEVNLRSLAAFNRLSALNMSGSPITGTAFQSFPRCLTQIGFSQCEVVGQTIVHLAKFPFLQKLNLDNNKKIGGTCFEALPTSLTDLSLCYCDDALTDEDICRLSHLIVLRRLHFNNSRKVHGTALRYLPVSLVELGCTGCSSIEEPNYGTLTRLTHLRKLGVDLEVMKLPTILHLQAGNPKLKIKCTLLPIYL